MVNGVAMLVVIILVPCNNSKKKTLVLGKDQRDGLDDGTITTEAKYSTSISKSKKGIC